MNKICILSKKIEEENDNNKYNQFIKKYEIKKDYDIIIGYLNNLVTYILPDSNNQKNNTKEKKESDDEEEVDTYENEKKRKEEILNNEKILRNSIQLLFNKEEKFMEYIEIYLKYHFNKYINESKNNIEEKIKKKINKLKTQKLIYYKLEKIIEIINELKLFKFNIKDNFENFIEENYLLYPRKVQALEKKKAKTIKLSFEDFIKKIKIYIGNNADLIDIYSEEPNDYIFRLFRYKIGLDI